MNFTDLLLLAALAFVPPLVGYGRGLSHWTMTKIWLWLGLLPVAGWFVALAIALSADCSET